MQIITTATELARTWSRPAPAPTTDNPVRLAIKRVGKILTAFVPGMPFDRDRAKSRLDSPVETASLETERLFCRGWLHWLDGEFTEAEPLLAESVERSKDEAVGLEKGEEEIVLDQLARSAYWLSRVRVLLEREDAISEYEGILRLLRGSPQGTAWYIDLLWRAGRVDRAEQVWKSVRTNRKVTGCDEGVLLEARGLLRRGETTTAERHLQESTPGNGVVQSERCLYLAWIATARKHPDQAEDLLHQAEQRPYPDSALEHWRSLLESKSDPTGDFPNEEAIPPSLRSLFRAQNARLQGHSSEAKALLGEAKSQPAAAVWADYLLAVLGAGDRAEVFGNPSSLFLAVRSRGWSALERFRERQATADHWLSELHQQLGQGFQTNDTVEHFHQLGALLAQKRPVAEALRQVVEEHADEEPGKRRNFLVAAVEQAARHLSNHAAQNLLREWLALDWVTSDEALSNSLRQQLLRLMILDRIENPTSEPIDESLLEGEPLLALLDGKASTDPDCPSARLATAAGQLADGSLDSESWQANVRALRAEKGYKTPAQILLFQEAASRQDIPAVGDLLKETDHWRSSRTPPRFVFRTLINLVTAHAQNPIWKQVLPSWLALWRLEALDEEGQRLQELSGDEPSRASQGEPPAGVEPASWFLHQMSKAVLREDYQEALACLCRARSAAGELAKLPESALVQESLPELERHAAAQSLVESLEEGTPTASASLLNVVDLLKTFSAGQRLLDDIEHGDLDHIREGLESLVEIPDLHESLWHHLALIELRQALALDEQGRVSTATPYFQRSWGAWLHHLDKAHLEEGSLTRPGELLLDSRVTYHRQRISDLLTEDRIDDAREHWHIVYSLFSRLEDVSDPLQDALIDRLSDFRDRLATAYLTTTREAMRYGDIPEGWHSDYEKGLGYLRRLLSLDNENVRLLTALVEICNDWFLDLYNSNDPGRIFEELDRYKPFAMQLFRIVEEDEGDLAAKGALSDFYKFRGFMSRDIDERRNLYEEALRLNPGNKNARELLTALDGDDDGYDDDDFDESLDDDFDAPSGEEPQE